MITRVFAPFVSLRDRWIADMRSGAFHAPASGWLTFVSKGRLVTDNIADVVGVMQEASGLGLRCAPAASCLEADEDHTPADWFNRALWQQMADVLAKLLAAWPCGSVALDFEAGWAKGTFEELWALGERIGELADVLAPVVQVLTDAQVTPYLLPGGLQYPPVALIAQATDGVLCSETTYPCPQMGPAGWQRMADEFRQAEQVGLRWMAGVRDYDFTPAYAGECRGRGIPVWIFERGKLSAAEVFRAAEPSGSVSQ